MLNVLPQRVRALIVERCGTAAHLATAAREMGVTVVLVADVMSRHTKDGTDNETTFALTGDKT